MTASDTQRAPDSFRPAHRARLRAQVHPRPGAQAQRAPRASGHPRLLPRRLESRLQRPKWRSTTRYSPSFTSTAPSCSGSRSMAPGVTRHSRRTGSSTFPLLADFEPKGDVSRLYGAYRDGDGNSEARSSSSNGDGHHSLELLLNRWREPGRRRHPERTRIAHESNPCPPRRSHERRPARATRWRARITSRVLQTRRHPRGVMATTNARTAGWRTQS